MLAVDLSNLCRDRRVAHLSAFSTSPDISPEIGPTDLSTEIAVVDQLVAGIRSTGIVIDKLILIADRNLPHHVDEATRRRLRELERDGRLEYSSVADERLLELAFGSEARPGTLIASMDWFDDFRRTFPAIQGCTDRFIGWEPYEHGSLRVHLRDMGVHTHRRISRKEEAAELKARRLERKSLVRQATLYEYTCACADCLLAQLWPDRLPELPRWDDRNQQFVCPSCNGPVEQGRPRAPSVTAIVQLDGTEHFRLVIEEGKQVVIGRREGTGRVGLAERIEGASLDAISRDHLALRFDGSSLTAEDLASRNGTLLRDPSGRERRLRAAEPQVFGPRATVVLPGGVSIELSGRAAHAPAETDDASSAEAADTDGRVTRILATRR